MTDKTYSAADAVNTAPISADLRRMEQPAAPEFALGTSAGGRGYVAWHFANVLQRHDFTDYINNALAADFACALARHLQAAQPAPECLQQSVALVLTEQMAYDIGAKGAPATEAERVLFEAWMRGHCWALCAEWDGKGYRSAAEFGGEVDPRAMRTRQLFAAWRDRAALQAAPPLNPVEPGALHASIRELDAWESRADGNELTPSESESVVLVLHELKRLQAAPPAPAGVAVPTESVLIDGIAYEVPAAVAGELLSLHLDLLAAAPAQAVAVPTAERQRMTAGRASFFMERFLKEEKLLGPNEQAALHFVIDMLAAPAQEDARDMEAEALRACRDLPEGWEIEIHLERGYGVVTVIDPQGNDDELPVDGTLFDALKESIDTAIRDDAARAAQGGAV